MAEIELFYWSFPEGGYEWQEAKAEEHFQVLSDADRNETRFLVKKPTERHWPYSPLTKFPTLFKEFASLEPTADAFLRFANSYGELGVGVMLARNGPIAAYDPFHRWADAHRSMGPIVDVLTALQNRDAETLKQWFELAANGAKYHRNWPNGGWAASWVTIADQHREYIWTWALEASSDNEAIFRVAQGWAQEEINNALRGSGDRATLTTASVVFDLDRKRMTMRLTPRNLLGALWLQCARVLALNPTFKTCGNCGKWFELSPDTRRRQSKYCSDRCKVAKYRAKKKGEAALVGAGETAPTSGV